MAGQPAADEYNTRLAPFQWITHREPPTWLDKNPIAIGQPMPAVRGTQPSGRTLAIPS